MAEWQAERANLLEAVQVVDVRHLGVIVSHQQVLSVDRKGHANRSRGSAQGRHARVISSVIRQELVGVLPQQVNAVPRNIREHIGEPAGHVDYGAALIRSGVVYQQPYGLRKVNRASGREPQQRYRRPRLPFERAEIHSNLHCGRGDARRRRNGHAWLRYRNGEIRRSSAGVGDGQGPGENAGAGHHQVLLPSLDTCALVHRAYRQDHDAAFGYRIEHSTISGQHGATHDVFRHHQPVSHGQVVGIHQGEHRQRSQSAEWGSGGRVCGFRDLGVGDAVRAVDGRPCDHRGRDCVRILRHYDSELERRAKNRVADHGAGAIGVHADSRQKGRRRLRGQSRHLLQGDAIAKNRLGPRSGIANSPHVLAVPRCGERRL